MVPFWFWPYAVACGNTYIIKPSEQDPLSTMMLVELALEAGIPPGVLNVVHGGKDVVDALCTHEHIKAISFVGSTTVGTHVYRLGSEHGKRVQSMMGAKNHAVVLPDANREQTLNALAGAAFGAAGQRCMATSVVVLVGAAQQWVPELVEKAKTLKVNAGVEPGTDVGPVVSRAAKQRILGLIESGVQQGAKLALDGRNVQVKGYEDGNFVGPTIFTDVTTDMDIYTNEIFGPVMVVLTAATLDEAIALVNANPFGNGVGLKFPARYQDALFAGDWSYGYLHSTFLTPKGSSYEAVNQVFIEGRPFPVTGVTVNKADGSTVDFERDLENLGEALRLAREAAQAGEVPVGAVVVV